MNDLDLRRLRYFLAVADELNYGRAAELLHIAQPALSRAIATLERELGVTLFERSRSGTRLTAAGESLRSDAQELLRAAETAQRRARVAHREGRGLALGFMPGLIMTPLVRRLETCFPALRVDVVRTSWTEQITFLREGRVDASFAHRPFDTTGLVVVDLFTEPRVAVLPSGHVMAGATEVGLRDLAADVLLQPAASVPGWTGAVRIPRPAAADRTAGYSPTVEEKLELVAARRGIVILPASTTRYYRRPDVSFAPVLDLPDTEVCLAVEARRRSEVLSRLIEMARTIPPAALRGQPDTDPASVGTK